MTVYLPIYSSAMRFSAPPFPLGLMEFARKIMTVYLPMCSSVTGFSTAHIHSYLIGHVILLSLTCRPISKLRTTSCATTWCRVARWAMPQLWQRYPAKSMRWPPGMRKRRVCRAVYRGVGYIYSQDIIDHEWTWWYSCIYWGVLCIRNADATLPLCDVQYMQRKHR